MNLGKTEEVAMLPEVWKEKLKILIVRCKVEEKNKGKNTCDSDGVTRKKWRK